MKIFVSVIFPGTTEKVLTSCWVWIGNAVVYSLLDWSIGLFLRTPVYLSNESTDDDD